MYRDKPRPRKLRSAHTRLPVFSVVHTHPLGHFICDNVGNVANDAKGDGVTVTDGGMSVGAPLTRITAIATTAIRKIDHVEHGPPSPLAIRSLILKTNNVISPIYTSTAISHVLEGWASSCASLPRSR
jgi:hypothetical protein